ncbi:hypothetical protein [Streptomyces blattellae]|uniref:hypothetical protein n=1 Tax=Streptomyces blattellae TaxID=2569855 RepID=UPI0012B75D7E|nr:hypothetical protein [Streptomyces blattellae]
MPMTTGQAAANLTQGRTTAQNALPAGGQPQDPAPAPSIQPVQPVHPIQPVQQVPAPHPHPQRAPFTTTEPAPGPLPPLPKFTDLNARQQMAMECALCSAYLGASGRVLGDVRHRGRLFRLWACAHTCTLPPGPGGPR